MFSNTYGFEPKTIDTRMIAVVTFFNRWLKVKLRLDAKDWPETHGNDPEPYTDDEAARPETASAGEINLLIRTFRQMGCRDMELAHLNDTDLLDSKEIYIREKQCVIVGGQFGSEGKGHIASLLSREYKILVRVGGPNAGHKVFVTPGHASPTALRHFAQS